MMKMCHLFQRVGGGASLLIAGLAISACAVDGGPADDAADPPSAEADLAAGPATATTTQSVISAGAFKNLYCVNGPFAFVNCHTGPGDDGVMGNLDGTHTNISAFEVVLCVNFGTVTLRTWVDGAPLPAVSVNAGACRIVDWSAVLFNADSIRNSTTIDSASANYFLSVKWSH